MGVEGEKWVYFPALCPSLALNIQVHAEIRAQRYRAPVVAFCENTAAERLPEKLTVSVSARLAARLQDGLLASPSA